MNELEAGRISNPLYRTASSLRRLRTSGHGTNSSFLCRLQSWVAGLHPSQSAGWRPYPAALMALVILSLPVSCCHALPTASVSPVDRSGASEYPGHWWAPISKEGAPAWEILPQEAGAGEVILSKRNELGLLSNFASTPFKFHGRSYASLEGFWQMMKFPESEDDPRAKSPDLKWPWTRDRSPK